ncbi:MAG: hypothetical protein ACRDRI_19740 [Pseudonocardiaceae bacterium]
MSDHLKVDVALIRATASGLGLIKDALQGADAGNPGAAVLGLGGLAEAMDEFAHNWDIHRRELISAVEAHQKMAVASADAYEHTDTELAKALTQHSSSGNARAAS